VAAVERESERDMLNGGEKEERGLEKTKHKGRTDLRIV
jgi:hypothetical protein